MLVAGAMSIEGNSQQGANIVQKKDKKGKLNWLPELMQLRPYGESGLTKGVRGMMNIWSPLTLGFLVFIAFVWYEFGLLAFTKPFAIALALVVPSFLLVMDIINFIKDEDDAKWWINYSRIGLSVVLTLFTSVAFQLSVFHDDITDLQRAKIVHVAHDKIDAAWNPQIKTAEANLASVNTQIDTDRAALAAQQKTEMDQSLATEKGAIDAIQHNTAHAALAYDSASKAKALRKDADARHLATEALREKQKTESAAFDAGIEGKRKAPQVAIVALREQKSQEEKSLKTLSNTAVETKYGVVIKTGLVDQLKTLYIELPAANESAFSIWLGIFMCYVLIFILELGPFLARNLAKQDLADYYRQSLQKALQTKRDNMYAEICIAAAPAMNAISEWRKACDEEIGNGIPSHAELNNVLRRQWTLLVDAHVTTMYVEAAKRGDAGLELLGQFLEKNGYPDLRDSNRYWFCPEEEAATRWNFKATARGNVAHLPARTHS